MQTSEAFHIIPLSYRWGKCTLTKSVMGTGAVPIYIYTHIYIYMPNNHWQCAKYIQSNTHWLIVCRKKTLP